jgi:hypothetical protein
LSSNEPTQSAGEQKGGASMSDHLIYVDRFQVGEGKFEDFKRYGTEM